MRKAVFRDDASGLSITDAHVVNHSIKAAYPIQLFGHPLQILQPSPELAALLEKGAKEANVGLTVQVYPGASLFKPNQQWNAMVNGQLDIALFPLDYASGKVPAFSATLMPGLIRNQERAKRRWRHGGDREGREWVSLCSEGERRLCSAYELVEARTEPTSRTVFIKSKSIPAASLKAKSRRSAGPAACRATQTNDSAAPLTHH